MSTSTKTSAAKAAPIAAPAAVSTLPDLSKLDLKGKSFAEIKAFIANAEAAVKTALEANAEAEKVAAGLIREACMAFVNRVGEILGRTVTAKEARGHLAVLIEDTGEERTPADKMTEYQKGHLRFLLETRQTALKANTPGKQLSDIAREVGCSEMAVTKFRKEWKLAQDDPAPEAPAVMPAKPVEAAPEAPAPEAAAPQA